MNQKPSSYSWWRDAPPLVRRHYRRCVVISVAMCGVGMALSLIDLVELIGPRWTKVFAGVWILSMPVLLYVVLKPYKRLMKRIEAVGYKLCTECGYQLTGLTGQTDCPECGTACDLEEVEAMWTRFRTKIVARRQ